MNEFDPRDPFSQSAPVERNWEEELAGGGPPGWPKGIGITSIVLGSLGIVCGGLGAASAIFAPQLVAMNPEMANMEMGPMSTLGTLDYVLFALGLLGSITLLAAGIATTTRSLTGRWLHLAYGIGKLLLLLLTLWNFLDKRVAHLQWAETQPADNPFAAPSQTMSAMIGTVVGLVLGALWPIFCIIWFGMIKKTKHDFTGGYERAA